MSPLFFLSILLFYSSIRAKKKKKANGNSHSCFPENLWQIPPFFEVFQAPVLSQVRDIALWQKHVSRGWIPYSKMLWQHVMATFFFCNKESLTSGKNTEVALQVGHACCTCRGSEAQRYIVLKWDNHWTAQVIYELITSWVAQWNKDQTPSQIDPPPEISRK